MRQPLVGPLLAIAMTMTSACTVPIIGSQRTVKHFCDTYWDEKYAYLHKYSDRQQAAADSSDQDPFGAVLMTLESTVEAMGDIEVMFDKLDKAAPDDIEPDVAAIRDAFKQAEGSLGSSVTDPLGALITNFVTSMAVQGSWQRVGHYVVENCGERG